MTEMVGLGRRPQWDRRNLDFPVPKLTTARLWRMWSGGPVLDQGATPQCVGYAGWGWLRGGPVINKDLPFTPTDLYNWAQERDEWPGEDYEGTSTLGLMKALKDKGYISEYRWALDAETLVSWVLENGPVVVGTNWYMDMFTPDRRGFINPAGENVGGHEWRIVGASRTRQCPDGTTGAVRMINSWGTGWGDKGRAWVSITDLDRLIKEDGEAVTAPELKL